MSTRGAYVRIICGAILIAFIYLGPLAVGTLTAGSRMDACLRKAPDEADIVVKLAFIPGPTEIELLQGYGRYGGSGGDLHNVVLLEVPEANIRRLSRLYWIKEIAALDSCAS